MGNATEEVISLICEKVKGELLSATEKFGPFNSTHEGYAVIKEELDELWDEIKKNGNEHRLHEGQ